MATATPTLTLGPADHGRTMTLAEFIAAEWTGGCLYELARGVVDVTQVPGPNHGLIVMRVADLFALYHAAHPGVIRYRAGGAECRIRLPGAVSDRHPDHAVYLLPMPKGADVWVRWVPQIVVEVVSRRGEKRDFVDKREEYLLFGVLEYWIIDPRSRKMHVLRRAGGDWRETVLGEDDILRTDLLPGLAAIVGELLGPPAEDDDEDNDLDPTPP